MKVVRGRESGGGGGGCREEELEGSPLGDFLAGDPGAVEGFAVEVDFLDVVVVFVVLAVGLDDETAILFQADDHAGEAGRGQLIAVVVP